MNQSQKNNTRNSERNQKLYSPYEYLHYTNRINDSKNQYLTSLVQLGYDTKHIQDKKYQQILLNTDQIIKKTYCTKYIGVIDENMGVLSKRQQITKLSNKQNYRSHEENIKFNQQKGYVVDKYSLPNALKSIRMQKDQYLKEQKQKTEEWRQNLIKEGLVQNGGKEFVIHSQNSKSVTKRFRKTTNKIPLPDDKGEGIVFQQGGNNFKKNQNYSYSQLLNKIENVNIQNLQDQDENFLERFQKIQKKQI